MSILKRIAKLIDVKSLVTLALTATFIILSLNGVIDADKFMSIFTVIISFYFGTQVGKRELENQKEGISNDENEESNKEQS